MFVGFVNVRNRITHSREVIIAWGECYVCVCDFQYELLHEDCEDSAHTNNL